MITDTNILIIRNVFILYANRYGDWRGQGANRTKLHSIFKNTSSLKGECFFIIRQQCEYIDFGLGRELNKVALRHICFWPLLTNCFRYASRAQRSVSFTAFIVDHNNAINIKSNKRCNTESMR